MGIYMARLKNNIFVIAMKHLSNFNLVRFKLARFNLSRLSMVKTGFLKLALRLSVLTTLILAGCTGDPVITPDSELRLSPPSSTYEIQESKDNEGNCIFSPEFYQDVPIRMVVTDGLGRAILEAPVTVYVDYAGNTFSGLESLQLYSDTVSYTHLTLPTKA